MEHLTHADAAADEAISGSVDVTGFDYVPVVSYASRR